MHSEQIAQLNKRQIQLNKVWMEKYKAPSLLDSQWQFSLMDHMKERFNKPRALFFVQQIEDCFGKNGLNIVAEVMKIQQKIVKLECGEED